MIKTLLLGLVFIVALACPVFGYYSYQPSQQYALAVHSSGHSPRMVGGIKSMPTRGPYFNAAMRGSRENIGFVSYVPDTYRIHRLGGVSGNPVGSRLPGLPFRASGNHLIWVN